MTTPGMFTASCFLTRGDMKASEGSRSLWKKTPRVRVQGKHDNRPSPGVFLSKATHVQTRRVLRECAAPVSVGAPGPLEHSIDSIA